MAAEGNNIRMYIYRGEEGEVIPRDGQIIVIVHKDITVILAEAFNGRRNIVEVICHENVEKIEEVAFACCTSLKRAIMPGVKIVEWQAFSYCTALTDVECGKLKIIKELAFNGCGSLRSINLPSVEIVEEKAFASCFALTDVECGKLEIIKGRAFYCCTSLRSINLPSTEIVKASAFSECRFSCGGGVAEVGI